MPRQRGWTDEQLRAAVASSTSYRKVLQALGSSGTGSLHYDIKNRIRVLALDTSHFDRRRADRPWTDDELRAAVRDATSYVATLAKLGLEIGRAHV